MLNLRKFRNTERSILNRKGLIIPYSAEWLAHNEKTGTVVLKSGAEKPEYTVVHKGAETGQVFASLLDAVDSF